MIDIWTARLAAVLVALAIGGAGCSSEVAGTATAPPGAGAAPSRSTPVPGPAADPVAQVRAALLGPADLGPGWVAVPSAPPDPTAPAVCGGPDLTARFPGAVPVTSDLAGPDPDTFASHTVAVLADAATARAAFDAVAEGLDCAEGVLAGQPAVVTPAEDLTFDLGGDRALGWRIGTDTADVLAFTVLGGPTVTTFVYLAPVGYDWSATADLLAVSRAAVERVLAA